VTPIDNCFTLLRQAVCLAAAFAWAKTGNKIAAKIAMIAMTTSNSINVNAALRMAQFYTDLSAAIDVVGVLYLGSKGT